MENLRNERVRNVADVTYMKDAEDVTASQNEAATHAFLYHIVEILF